MSDHDDDLGTELRALGRWLDVPEAVDQRIAVRERLTQPKRPRRRVRRWVLASVAALVGTVVVVAPARAAVVDAVGGLLRVAGIEVRREPGPGGLPAHPSALPSQRSATLDQARRVALFPLREPTTLGPAGQVLLADPGRTGAPRVVTVTYRGGTVSFDQFDGTVDPVFFKTAPDAQWVDVAGEPGIWLPGPHAVTYIDRDGVERTETARLAAPTLIWVAGTITYRLEGLSTLEDARAAALSLR
jgi:hypothetical protein